MTEPLPGSIVNGAFIVSAGGGAGLTANQIRAERFSAPTRGARVLNDAGDQDIARATAVLLVSNPQVVLCDVTAARLWDLPLPPWIWLRAGSSPVSAAGPSHGGRPQRVGVRGRRLAMPTEHTVEHRGVQVTTPARTWLDCAEAVPIEHLVAMGDAILRRELATHRQLDEVIRWAKRRRGVRTARLALPVLDPLAESPAESIVRAHLVLGGLPKPQCNLDIVVSGEWLARADIAWPHARLIVEYDGLHHLDERQRRSDAARRNLLQAAGWRVITITADDLKRPWLMVSAIRAALADAGHRGAAR